MFLGGVNTVRYIRLTKKRYAYLANENLRNFHDDDDISYEISVNDKRYEAIFYQMPDMTDTLALQNDVRAYFLTKYTEEQIAEPAEEIQKDMIAMAVDFSMNKMRMKPVWFVISEFYGKYYITMFYDNEYNRANGEDL